MAMSNTEIKDLFDVSRFPSGWKLFSLVIYTPIGLVLATLRLLIGLQAITAAALLPPLSIVRYFVLRSLCLVLGIVVRKESERDDTVRVLVSNHIAPCDHLPVHVLTQCVTPTLWDLPPGILSSALGLKDLGMRQGRDTLITQVCSHIDKETEPVLVFPEGEMTSGKVGLLKFATWPFCLRSAIQPVAVTAWRMPIAEVAITRFASKPWADLFWFMFVPCTFFTIKFMPSIKRVDDETEQAFASRVETAIANELQLKTTNHTAGDKAELLKRLSADQNRSVIVQNPTGMMNSELQRMATQVGEVLPSVPHDTIVRDLLKTRSVDVTISNILEGLVQYVPKPVPQASTSSTPVATSSSNSSMSEQSSSSSTQGATCLDTSAKSFARSPQERTMSFKERKARLIENARNKYIEKHKLKIVGYNC